MLLAAPASAQEIATTFDQLRGLVKADDTIVVTDAKGHRTRGPANQLSAFSEGDVREIEVERGDSILNGTLIGAAVGGWPWLGCLADCTYGEPGGENLLRVVFAFTTAIGAGVGALVDASIKDRVTVFLSPSRTSVGTPASTLRDLGSRLKPGDTVYVTETGGRLTRGKLRELSTSSLEILVPEKRADGREAFVARPQLAERDVREIQLERHDSIRNGLLIGLGIGVGIGVVSGNNRCSAGDCDGNKAGTIAGITGAWAAIGAGLGAWIDWAKVRKERTTVYVAP